MRLQERMRPLIWEMFSGQCHSMSSGMRIMRGIKARDGAEMLLYNFKVKDIDASADYIRSLAQRERRTAHISWELISFIPKKVRMPISV